MARAVLFDVDGVMVHGMHSNPAHVRRWDANMQADLGVDPERFTKEFIFDIFLKRVIIGEMSILDALERRLPALGYRGSPMVFLDYWLTRDSVLNLDLIETIQQLKSSGEVRCFIATNQEHMRAGWLWSHLGLKDLFEDIFYSARIGARKPDRRFFKFVDDRMGPQSEPPLFFDDSPDVVTGAKSAGWEAVLFNTTADCLAHPWIAAHLGGNTHP